jgi:hypothetical protein
MGTKGSFAIAQLTDLIFVEFCLKEEYPGIPSPFFMKVGDDLVVYDPKLLLRKRYEQIGVPINLSKSKFQTSTGSFIEFVSRNSWNGFDYSIISPSLLPKFRKEDFYSATFYKHIKERSKLFNSFNDLYQLKRELASRKANADLEKFEERFNKIMMIISLVGIAEDDKLIEPEDCRWNNMSSEDIILFFQYWILAILGEFVHKIYSDYMNDETTNSKRTIDLLVRESILLSVDTTTKDSADLFFQKAIQNGLSLKEACILQQSMNVVYEMDNRHEKGLEILKSREPAVLLFDKSRSDDNVWVVRPQGVKYLLNLVDRIGQMDVSYKTIKRLSLFNKANTKSAIHLHQHLYNVLSLKEIPLDFNTGLYILPKNSGKENADKVTLNLEWASAYIRLLRFDDILAQLASVRSQDKFEVVLHPVATRSKGNEPITPPDACSDQPGDNESKTLSPPIT